MDDAVLHAAAGIGAYRWGSLLLETSTLAPANGRVIARALAGASSGGLVAESEAFQRATIAVLHELVHLQQDLATGLGAWDHVVDREAYPRLVNQSRWFIFDDTQPPYREVVEKGLDDLGSSAFTNQVRGDLEAIRNRTVGLRQLTGGEWATPDVQAALQRRLSVGVEDVGPRSLRTMFEGEAAGITYLQIADSRFDDAGLEWIEQHRNLWHVVKMGGDYLRPVIDVATAWLNHQPSVNEIEEIFEGITGFISLAAWVVDLASAYPPPSLLEEWPGDPAEFDPVLRYLLILRALNELDADRGERLLRAVVGGDWGGAEAIFRDGSSLPYPASAQIYERWLTELDPLLSSDNWDAPLFELRAAAMRARLDGLRPKGIEAIMTGTTPVQVLVQGIGMQGILHGKQLFDANVRGAMLARRSDMELFDLFQGNGRFRCPYGRANMCDARQERCLTGMTRVSSLPTIGCQVRKELEELGYAI
jgi:hypothetical protein